MGRLATAIVGVLLALVLAFADLDDEQTPPSAPTPCVAPC